MKKTPGLLLKLIQVLLFIPLQVGFIPIAIVGLMHALFKEMVVGARLGVSFSAIQALQYRWIMHHFGTRADPASVDLIKQLPCESHLGLWSTFGALIVAQRLFGLTTKLGRLDEPGKETWFSTPGRRLLVFDEIVAKHVDEMEQIVIPGAGFDLVALRYTRGRNIRLFELDQADTLKVKVETLERAGIAHDWITFVPVDYAKESWVDELLSAGFDKTKKTLFLWQSVSLFLEADVVAKTLEEMAGLCAGGSIVAQDFYAEAFISGRTSKAARRAAKVMAKRGEPWRFGVDMSNEPRSAVESLLNDCGLTMTEYFQFGEKLRVDPFYCIVEAKPVDGA